MYISEQLINPDANRLRLSAQLGVERVVIDNRGTELLASDDGRWNKDKLTAYRQWIESFGLKIDVFALDVGSILLTSLVDREAAQRHLEVLQDNIRIAAAAGISCLKYNVQMVGITRTALREGRGGCRYSSFSLSEYSPDADRQFSYWGVGYPSNQEEGGADSSLLCGQQMARQVPEVSQADGWKAIEFLVSGLVPVAQEVGVKLACHPHDPAYPVGGLNGVEHVMGSLDGIARFLALSSSPVHGLNFCQGTVAEMSADPHAAVMEAIERFGKRIFMVHFRNIKGGYLDFSEVFPDEGDVDMYQALLNYRRVGYQGPLCPDHVPVSDQDPNRERFMSFALGYTKALLQASAHQP
ncbi:mannonate dehydratase [Paralcaligenes sp. KSB-10]|uniref:mannonate dehydratase n=1 Tax=Paralcaligenes sp. KSB-10 TaxID=2901142 RepID=UPI001E4FF03B|nr:mannonate dehydratase [Paralcaligenes sp. KSB-10]UHL65976.1 mannonate dehydratase [Paralcaligenes sp. KSB-10]